MPAYYSLKTSYNTHKNFLQHTCVFHPTIHMCFSECISVRRNVVIERFVKGVQSICVSISPINQCSGSCLSSTPRKYLPHQPVFRLMPVFYST